MMDLVDGSIRPSLAPVRVALSNHTLQKDKTTYPNVPSLNLIVSLGPIQGPGTS